MVSDEYSTCIPSLSSASQIQIVSGWKSAQSAPNRSGAYLNTTPLPLTHDTASPSRSHGGGYRFSLCPLPKTFRGRMDVTEGCFNDLPLKFAGNTQFIEDNLSGKRTEIKAVQTTNGTFPTGSMVSTYMHLLVNVGSLRSRHRDGGRHEMDPSRQLPDSDM